MVLKKLLLDKAAGMKLPDVDKEVNDAVDYAKNKDPHHQYTDAEFAALLKTHGMTLDQWKQNLHDIATMQAVITSESSKDTTPSEQEIDAIYKAHQDAFQVPPMVRASRVLILVAESDTAADKAKKKKADRSRPRPRGEGRGVLQGGHRSFAGPLQRAEGRRHGQVPARHERGGL